VVLCPCHFLLYLALASALGISGMISSTPLLIFLSIGFIIGIALIALPTNEDGQCCDTSEIIKDE
jgi:hypothetical protein